MGHLEWSDSEGGDSVCWKLERWSEDQSLHGSRASNVEDEADAEIDGSDMCRASELSQGHCTLHYKWLKLGVPVIDHHQYYLFKKPYYVQSLGEN